jgi:hypothetical protein
MNEKSSLIFFCFWTTLLIVLCYDFLNEADSAVEGIVTEINYREYGRIIISNISVKNKDGHKYYKLDPVSVQAVKINDIVKIRQSKIFKRTVFISGPDYSYKTKLSFWNNVFFVLTLVSAIASFGSAFIYIRYVL